jgi:hypothetical protein
MNGVRVARGARWVLAFFLVIFIGAQFVRGERTNPPSKPEDSLLRKATPDVRAILQRSCADCHSNETVWPWYAHVAPMSWLVANDVAAARDRMNFSEWGGYDSDDQDKLFSSMCTMVTRRRMPLSQYLIIHRDAKLSDADIQAICGWTKKMRDTLK